MSSATSDAPGRASNEVRWARVRDSGLGILAWVAVVFVSLWAIGHITRALLLLTLAALLAYGVTPGVARLQRWMPRWLATVLVYVVALVLIGGLGFVITSTAVAQLVSLAKDLPKLLQPSTPGHPSPLVQLGRPLGITEAQVNAARQQVITWIGGSAGTVASNAIPIITGVANGALDLVLVFVLSIYLVADGSRAVAWLRTAAPTRQRARVKFFLDILERTVGGYIRGQVFMSALIGVLVGGGMFAFGVPYALLLGVLAFILEFIPILGTLVSGAICVLVALPTRGLLLAALVLVYFIIVHVIEGDVVGPRVIGRVLGLHPVVAIVALVIGSDLFGIWGALFAAPVSGVIQSILVAAWSEWRADQLEAPPATPPPSAQVPQPDALGQPTTRDGSRVGALETSLSDGERHLPAESG